MPALGGIATGIISAAFAVPGLIGEMRDISESDAMTKREKSKAKGGAAGEAAGSLIGGIAGGLGGAAATAAACAAIGSVVPGVGTVVGLLVGGVIGALGMSLGGAAGRTAGEKIAGGLAAETRANPRAAASPLYRPSPLLSPKPFFDETQNIPKAAALGGRPPVSVDGEIKLQSQLVIDDSGYKLNQHVIKNTTPFKFEAGSSSDARLSP